MKHDAILTDTTRRTAIFVDGDNIRPGLSETLLKTAQKIGRVDIARVYTDENNVAAWSKAAGFKHILAGTGKNSTDMLLCIEAMETVLEQSLRSVLIATSDRDFTHLALNLKERGVYVMGLGEEKTSKTFRQACHAFEILGADATPKLCAQTGRQSCMSKMDQNIRNVIKTHATSCDGLPITKLSTVMKNTFNTRISTHAEKRWHAYLSNRKDLYEVDPKGPNARVRIVAL